MKIVLTSPLLHLFLFSLTIQVFYIAFGFLKVSELFNLVTFGSPHNGRTILFYAYFEKNKLYSYRLQFFLDFAVKETDPIDYVFIIQGGYADVTFPNYKNIRIIIRPNDCFDFGAYGDTIKKIGGIEQIKKYKYVMFINPSASGPILPKYWPTSLHWSTIFTSKLQNDIHAVSTSVSCAPNNERGYGPAVESFVFAATPVAVEAAMNDIVFNCKKDKGEAIVEGEHRFSQVLLGKKLNFENLLLKYEENIDWRKGSNWNCNANMHPSGNKTYNYDEGERLWISVYPLENVFHKSYWDERNYYVYYDEALTYMELARNRTKLL